MDCPGLRAAIGNLTPQVLAGFRTSLICRFLAPWRRHLLTLVAAASVLPESDLRPID